MAIVNRNNNRGVPEMYGVSSAHQNYRKYASPNPTGAGGDNKYSSRYENKYGDRYGSKLGGDTMARNKAAAQDAGRSQQYSNRARKQISYSLTQPLSVQQRGNPPATTTPLRRTFSSCKIIQSKEAKKSMMHEYIKDYCVYRLQLTPDKEHIPTPNTLVGSCWNSLDDARDTFSATICVSLFKKDSKEHRKMQKTFKEAETPARYRLRLQKFLKGPMEASLSQVRLTKLSDSEKVKVFRSMLERLFQESEARSEENMYEEVVEQQSHQQQHNNRHRHYMQVTLNEVFSIRKLEKLFIMIARHCCFYACIKMDFMVKSILLEAADFLVESLIFDWMMSKLGGMKGWAQVYEMEKEINAGRAKAPSKANGRKNNLAGNQNGPNNKTRQQESAYGNRNMAGGDYGAVGLQQQQRMKNQKQARVEMQGGQNGNRSRNNGQPPQKENPKSTGCSCVIV